MAFIPNLLSLLRILLIPVFIKYLLNGDYFFAAIIFILSAISDFLDGYIARKYNFTSKLGKILDPLADKLTIIIVLLILVFKGIIPKFIAYIILTREIFIFLGSGIAYIIGINVINPSNIGKLSMFLLYIAIIARLLRINYLDMTLFYIAIPLNIISGLDYLITTVKRIFN